MPAGSRTPRQLPRGAGADAGPGAPGAARQAHAWPEEEPERSRCRQGTPASARPREPRLGQRWGRGEPEPGSREQSAPLRGVSTALAPLYGLAHCYGPGPGTGGLASSGASSSRLPRKQRFISLAKGWQSRAPRSPRCRC